MIKYLKHNEIDRVKWDIALENSVNRLVYAQCWYLDIVNPGWEALVDDDYKAIMPLPAKKKYLIPYLIQPKYTQQLGIFSSEKVHQLKIEEFIKAIPHKFVWIDINLNEGNLDFKTIGITYQDNYTLDLNSSYENIIIGFSENSNRNISKSNRCGLKIEINSVSAIEYINEYIKNSNMRPGKTGEFQLYRLMTDAISRNIGDIHLIKDSLNEIIGGAFFLKQFNRIIYLCSFLTEKGRKKSAMYYLINSLIKENSVTPKVLDFEGSVIPGIAYFFKGFGSNCIRYPRLKLRLKK